MEFVYAEDKNSGASIRILGKLSCEMSCVAARYGLVAEGGDVTTLVNCTVQLSAKFCYGILYTGQGPNTTWTGTGGDEYKLVQGRVWMGHKVSTIRWGWVQELFSKVLKIPVHVLHPLLPTPVSHTQRYGLRPRVHDRTLLERSSNLVDCNFIIRMLYLNAY